jgi:hypothetical protein
MTANSNISICDGHNAQGAKTRKPAIVESVIGKNANQSGMAVFSNAT